MQLGALSRRRFGQGLGASLALTVTARSANASAVVTVSIRDFVFDPAVVSIRRGDTVRWVNRDLAPHTATADDGAWDTGELTEDAAAAIRFDRSGEHAYYCAYHPHMKGVVKVTG